jgi:hypothetical protein
VSRGEAALASVNERKRAPIMERGTVTHFESRPCTSANLTAVVYSTVYMREFHNVFLAT